MAKLTDSTPRGTAVVYRRPRQQPAAGLTTGRSAYRGAVLVYEITRPAGGSVWIRPEEVVLVRTSQPA